MFQVLTKGHYAKPMSREEEREGQEQQKQIAGSAETVVGLDELESKLETTFSMVSCLSTNTVSSVGWYVDSGASRHMTYDKKIFKQVSRARGRNVSGVG
jgi:hypothetical protein